MKYIGEGYYYKVYEVKPGRVFKKLQPYWFSFTKIYQYSRNAGVSVVSALLGAHRGRVREVKALQAIRAKLHTVPNALFAHAAFVRGLDYTQDLVTVVSDVLESNTFEANKDIIDQYVAFQKTLWSYGMHDTTFKLQPNYGVNGNGQLVCVDFGEFVYTKEAALKSIAGKKWLSRGTYKKWDDIPLKEYYTQRMAELMNEEVLDACWGSSQ